MAAWGKCPTVGGLGTQDQTLVPELTFNSVLVPTTLFSAAPQTNLKQKWAVTCLEKIEELPIRPAEESENVRAFRSSR
jgi:hypothetical protein